MEHSTQEPFQDSPVSSRSSTPTLSGRALTTKPLPSLPIEAAQQPLEPYRDDPSSSESSPPLDSSAPQHHRSTSNAPPAIVPIPFTPYTDHFESDDDVPLAYLYRYPTEAPPSYLSVVRDSYRATLIEHIPPNPASAEVDEEAGVERLQADDVRFKVERVVAAIIVSMMLLVITALLALVALNYANSIP